MFDNKVYTILRFKAIQSLAPQCLSNQIVINMQTPYSRNLSALSPLPIPSPGLVSLEMSMPISYSTFRPICNAWPSPFHLSYWGLAQILSLQEGLYRAYTTFFCLDPLAWPLCIFLYLFFFFFGTFLISSDKPIKRVPYKLYRGKATQSKSASG